MNRFWPALGRLAVTVILLLAVWLGLKDGFDLVRRAASWSQRIAAVSQLCYGIAAAATLWALGTRRWWLRWSALLWVLTVTIAGTLAPVAWGGAGWGTAMLGGAATAAVSALVAWGALAHARTPDQSVPKPM